MLSPTQAPSVRLRGQPFSTCIHALKRLRARVYVRSNANEAASLPAYKKAAAQVTVDKYIKSGQVVGLGTGEIAAEVTRILSKKLESGELKDVLGVPASDTAASEAAFVGLPLTNLDEHPKLDVFFDEVDALDVAHNAFIIGRTNVPQQPQLPRFHELATASSTFVALLHSPTCVNERLRGSVPVFIENDGWEEIAEELDDIFLGDAEIWRRPSIGTANPRGGDNPYISAQGHNIVDIRFYEALKLFSEDAEYAAIAKEISGVPGVVVHGLVLNTASVAVVSDPAGEHPQEIVLQKTPAS